MPKEEQKQEGQKREKGDIEELKLRNPLLLLALLLNTLTMGIIGFFQYQEYEREKNRESIYDVVRSVQQESSAEGKGNDYLESTLGKKPNNDDGILMPLDGFTSNLVKGDGPRRFLRLNAVLKFSQTSREEEFKARKPQIRDSIISILNSKRPGELLNKEGKEYLKEEIKSSINSFLIDGKVIDVYYVGFQIN